jgi:hypothetical protein
MDNAAKDQRRTRNPEAFNFDSRPLQGEQDMQERLSHYDVRTTILDLFWREIERINE